ncbi:MAG: Maf family protein [Thermoanaerobaculales bacterium]
MTGDSLPLVLASASPRRRELLAQLGLELIVVAPYVDERVLPGESPAVHALRVAGLKARAVTPRFPKAPVLAADTVVVLGEEILGKPSDRKAARNMLLALCGRTHMVTTAVVLALGAVEVHHVEHARVTFVPSDENLVRWYLESGEGDDKAGAYAVQGKGALFVERVQGNFQAVVGLPLAPLPSLFARVGLILAARDGRLSLRRKT